MSQFLIKNYGCWRSPNGDGVNLETVGFEVVQAHADFTFDSAAEDETSFIVLGKRPLF